jgi:outer membrane protein OmpA-like peptidoglycan-associated protein
VTAARCFGQAVVVAGVVALAAGCGISSLTNVQDEATNAPPVRLTEHVSSSTLVAEPSGTDADQSLSALLAAAALPNEYLAVMRPGTPPQNVVASRSPAPVSLVAHGRPEPPGNGETSYLEADYRTRLRHWQAEFAADQKAVAVRTQWAVSAWERGLQLPEQLRRVHAQSGVGLAQECLVAAGVLAGLEQDGRDLGSSRLLLLYTTNLTGLLPPGELTGDQVIVVSAAMPSAAATSSAQVNLLAAGAAQAAVLGPETTTTQLAALVRADLGQRPSRDLVSAPVLFANGSSTLLPAAIHVLAGLVPGLLRPGATAVVSGYASTPGTANANYLLSYARAAAAARYLESRNVPASALIIVGHGATDQFAPGASSANRRVLVVVQEPGS